MILPAIQFGNLLRRSAPVLLLVSAIVLNEWLFLVTKASIFSSTGWPESAFIGLSVTALCVLASGLVLLLLAVLAAAVTAAGSWAFFITTRLLTVFLATVLVLDLLDNFFYTLFGLGLRTMTDRESRLAGAVVLLVVIWAFRGRWSARERSTVVRFSQGRARALAAGASLTVVFAVGHSLGVFSSPSGLAGPAPTGHARPANVLIIGTDAVEAGHMSIYGYGRETTPFLSSKRAEFRILENSFSNNAGTFGSVGALLTGRLPVSTRVVYPPDVFVGASQYQHLPGLLRARGYASLDMSTRWYADPIDMNLRHSFAEANFRTAQDCLFGLGSEALCTRFTRHVLLMEHVIGKIGSILAAIDPFSAKLVSYDALSAPGQPIDYWTNDQSRIDRAIAFVSAEPGPWLVSLHLMATHGPMYQLTERHFSRGMVQSAPWQADFYDDAIRYFDGRVRLLYEHLEQRGLLEQTLIVISSDHGRETRVDRRLPLIFRFPDAAHAGSMSMNTSRIDVAPTLLDYLGIAVPDWMEGKSLLADVEEGLPVPRKVYFFGPSETAETADGFWHVPQIKPPFFSLGKAGVIDCHRASWIDLNTSQRHQSVIEDHTAPCGEAAPADTDPFEAVMQLLHSHQFDISGLK